MRLQTKPITIFTFRSAISSGAMFSYNELSYKYRLHNPYNVDFAPELFKSYRQIVNLLHTQCRFPDGRCELLTGKVLEQLNQQ